MNVEKQRLVFDLNDFVVDLERALSDSKVINEIAQVDFVEDVLVGLRDFVSHSDKSVALNSYRYLIKHEDVKRDAKMLSFIEACYKDI